MRRTGRGTGRAAAAAMVLLLAGCGGGGGGGVASSSSGTPVTTTTPTPAPTNTTLANLQYSQTFSTRPASLNASAQKGTGAISPANTEPAGTLTLAYDAATQSYTYAFNTFTRTFGPADRASNSNATLTAYNKQVGSVTETLGLFNAGSGNPTLVLTYASYGALQRLVDGSATVGVTQDYFVYGIPTAAADLPRTGTAAYQTVVDGSWASDGELRALTGTGSLSADFGAGTTSLRLTLGGANVLTGTTRQLDTFTGTGRIDTSDASFTGPVSPTASNYSGSYTGRFFGPAAAEAGASFTMTNPSGGVVAGAIVGRK